MKVSVIIANRNDTVMLAITVRSVIEELKGIDGEIVIVDNSEKKIFDLLPTFVPTGYINEKKINLIRQDFPCLFTARETAIKSAQGKYVLCLDSHMLIGRDMIRDLVSFMDRNSDNGVGFAHAPINWLHQHEKRSKHDIDAATSLYGLWGKTFYTHERTISWKGMPWICKGEWFLDDLNGYGALSENRISWGGGDLHIGCKPWLLGFQNWAVPCSPAIHIGPFPGGAKGNGYQYRLYDVSGIYPAGFGVMVSAYVLGGDELMERIEPRVQKRFLINRDSELWQEAKNCGANERSWLLKRQVMDVDEMIKTQPWDNN